MTYSTFQGKLPVVNFLEFENKIEIEIEIVFIGQCDPVFVGCCRRLVDWQHSNCEKVNLKGISIL